ncbi:MAG: ATP synthase F1 subunit delta [Deltaproteobacteria bacterium]|nr:ATP synthase F1 subunit delta [Deltaproteobacteria bacterium]
MIEDKIAVRYARALIELAKTKGKIDDFAIQLKDFLVLCKKSAILLPALTNKGFPTIKRIKILQDVLQQEKTEPLVLNFLKILIKKGRIELIPLIHEKYAAMGNTVMGRCHMTVVSATELPEKQYGDLKEVFSKKLGQTMILKKEVKKEVLGGVQVRIGNRVYDNTLKRQIQDLKEKCYAN